MKRWLLIALLVLAIAPGTWLRTQVGPADYRDLLAIERLDLPLDRAGEVELVGVWELDSRNEHFGSYSALVPLAGDRLLAVSDRGRWLEFGVPGTAPAPRFGRLAQEIARSKRQVDAEAATGDGTGRIWISFEGSNSIARHPPGLAEPDRVRPPEMARWSGNSGPEAMTRLDDGRFLVIGEGSPDWLGEGMPALLYDGDPVDGAAAIEFAFVPPEDFRATDMAALPDGRVLVLMRKIVWFAPPRFAAALGVFDPADIAEDEAVVPRVIAKLGTDIPHDNFEGLAVMPEADGALTLWLISDDNNAALQETLLYKLRWGSGTEQPRRSDARSEVTGWRHRRTTKNAPVSRRAFRKFRSGPKAERVTPLPWPAS